MKRKVIARLITVTALAAGAGIVALASRPEGRQKLASFGSSVAESWQSAREWMASYQQQATDLYSFKSISTNHQQRADAPQQEYSHAQ